MRKPREPSPPGRMLSTILATAFVALSMVVLCLYATLETISDLHIHEAALFSRQQLVAQDTARTISSYFQDNFTVLETTIRTSRLHGASAAEQQQILQSLREFRPIFERLVLLDADDHVLARSSRLSTDTSMQLPDRLKELIGGKSQRHKRTVSRVFIDPMKHESMVVLTVPVTDDSGDHEGTLLAELNLKSVWDLVDQLKVGETGYAYVADRKGNLLTFPNAARSLKHESVARLSAVADFVRNHRVGLPQHVMRYQGILGSTVVGSYAPVQMPDWLVVAELPWKEAYRDTLQDLAAAAGISLLLIVLAGVFGRLLANRLAAPVIDLTETATRIAAGERDLQATVGGPREVARLAEAFNSMTAQLRQSLKDLAQRLADMKTTEENLRLSEEHLRLALEGTSDGIWDWNLQTGQVYFNPRYYTMMGYKPDEFPPSYESWRQLVHPDDLDAAERVVWRAAEEISWYAIEFRFRARDGEWRWILGRGKVVEFDESGKAVRMAGSHTDITERKQMEEELRASRERLATVIEGSNDGFWDWYPATEQVYFSDRCYTMLGYSPGGFPVTADDWKSLVHPEDLPAALDSSRQHIEGSIPIFTIELRMRCRDGNYRWILSRGKVVERDAEGNALRMAGAHSDITERKQMEEELRASRERLSMVIEGSNDGFWDWYPTSEQAYFSDRCYTMLGYVPGGFPVTADDWKSLVHPEDHLATDEKFKQLIEGKLPIFSTELRMRCSDGDYRWILSRGKVVERDAEGIALRMAGTHSDITERKQAEEALRQEKLFLDTLIDGMPGVFYVFDEQGRFARWNKRLESTTGYDAEEIGRMHPTDFFLAEEKDHIAQAMQEVLTQGEAEVEANIAAKDGRAIPHYLTGLRILVDGKPHILGVGLDVTERKRAESESTRLQVLLKSVILQSPVPMVLTLADGTVELFNESCRSALGLEDELQLQPGLNLFTLEASWKDYDARGIYVPLSESPLARALQGETTRGRTMRIVRKDGTERWILVDAVPVHDDRGEVMASFLIFPDISERKWAEEALEKRVVALTRPLDATEGVVFEDMFDLSEIQRLQDLYAEAFGVAALITRPDGTPITQPSNFTELCAEFIRSNPQGASNCIHSDAMIGRHNPLGPNIQPCLSAGLCNAGVSITLGGHHVANWLVGQVRNEAQKEEEIMAYARELGADEEGFRAAYRKVPVMAEEQFERVAHALFHLANQVSTSAYQNVQQARFIAERKRAEAALRKYERIVSTSQDLMALTSSDYVIEAANESFVAALARPRKEILGHTLREVVDESVFREKVQPRLTQALAGQTVHFQEPFDVADRGRRIMDVTFFPMFDDTGTVEGVVINARDITDTRKLEEHLVHSQKIESLGTLAGGVAHEINNPINGIMNYAQLIMDRVDEESQAVELAGEIIHETQRVAAIVRNLLTFARHEKQAHSPAYLADIVSSVLSLIQTVMRHDQIDLQVDIPEDLPKLKCRSQQIQQVLMNLMTNARDALNERYPGYDPHKRLRVSARLFEKDGKQYIRTTVEDTGSGIPPEIRDRIFDPFFTTKPKETGTGLGLSISYGIVKNHHGELIVESEPGEYTRFHVELPVDNGWTLA